MGTYNVSKKTTAEYLADYKAFVDKLNAFYAEKGDEETANKLEDFSDSFSKMIAIINGEQPDDEEMSVAKCSQILNEFNLYVLISFNDDELRSNFNDDILAIASQAGITVAKFENLNEKLPLSKFKDTDCLDRLVTSATNSSYSEVDCSANTLHNMDFIQFNNSCRSFITLKDATDVLDAIKSTHHNSDKFYTLQNNLNTLSKSLKKLQSSPNQASFKDVSEALNEAIVSACSYRYYTEENKVIFGNNTTRQKKVAAVSLLEDYLIKLQGDIKNIQAGEYDKVHIPYFTGIHPDLTSKSYVPSIDKEYNPDIDCDIINKIIQTPPKGNFVLSEKEFDDVSKLLLRKFLDKDIINNKKTPITSMIKKAGKDSNANAEKIFKQVLMSTDEFKNPGKDTYWIILAAENNQESEELNNFLENVSQKINDLSTNKNKENGVNDAAKKDIIKENVNEANILNLK